MTPQYTKLRTEQVEAGGGVGGGDVVAPASATPGHLAVFGADPQHIEDGGTPGGGGLIYPTRATMWHDESLTLSGTTLSQIMATGLIYYFYCLQNPCANGNSFSNSFLLASGTYTFDIWGFADNNRGKIDWYVDDVLIVSGQDWASGSFKSVSSISIVGNGRHVLKGVINGSTTGNYYMCLTKFAFIPSSDTTSTD